MKKIDYCKILPDKKSVEVGCTCIFCHKQIVLVLPKKGYEDYCLGMNIEDCFPTVSRDDREILISNICSDCFDDTVSEEDGENEN